MAAHTPGFKKISFIVPTYNGVQYIERCVNSLLAQKHFDVSAIEVLLIDDGSSDDTYKISERYSREYPEIVRSFKHENMGVALTRNRGIDLAEGEYVAFVDQDDYIDSDFCFALYAAASDGDYDVVFSGMKRPDEHGRIVSKDVYKDTMFARLMCMSVWAKLHKTEFLKRNNIKLFNNKQGEDIAFTFEEFQKTDKIKGISYCGYNWFYNRGSVSNTSQRKLNIDNVSAIVKLQNRLFEIDEKKSNLTTFFITMLSAYYVFFSGKGSSSEQFIDGEQSIMNNLRLHRPGYLRSRYTVIAPSGILPVFSIGVKCYILLSKLNLMRVFAKVYCKGNVST
jgi:glycosyltransferase involved in cell wall biosynthesis